MIRIALFNQMQVMLMRVWNKVIEEEVLGGCEGHCPMLAELLFERRASEGMLRDYLWKVEETYLGPAACQDRAMQLAERLIQFREEHNA